MPLMKQFITVSHCWAYRLLTSPLVDLYNMASMSYNAFVMFPRRTTPQAGMF